jgi:hypothetical protein
LAGPGIVLAAGELALSPEYRIIETHGLPVSASVSGMACELRDYPEFNAIEWQVRLRAPTVGESPIY